MGCKGIIAAPHAPADKQVQAAVAVEIRRHQGAGVHRQRWQNPVQRRLKAVLPFVEKQSRLVIRRTVRQGVPATGHQQVVSPRTRGVEHQHGAIVDCRAARRGPSGFGNELSRGRTPEHPQRV